MNLHKLTHKLQEALQSSQTFAIESGHSEMKGLHLLRALLEQEQGITTPIFEKLGIPKDKIHLVLEPFGQVNKQSDRTSTYQQGTGLGLPLAKAMIELHDGSLTLESDTGQGTIASFTFPKHRILESK